jgi:hypothetical protein
MLMADHDPGRDDGGPLGRRFCWSGSEVFGDYPKLTRRTLMRQDTKNVGKAPLTLFRLLGKPAIQPDELFLALECCGGMVFSRSSPPSCCGGWKGSRPSWQ